MLDRPEFERWQEAADDALSGARAQHGAGLDNWACFLAEQAAQLALKGLLHGVGVAAWGHDLVDLGERVRSALNVELPDPAAASLRRLSRHYVASRYPDAHPAGAPGAHYGPEDAQEAVADADRVITEARSAWGQLLEAARHEETAPGGEEASHGEGGEHDEEEDSAS